MTAHQNDTLTVLTMLVCKAIFAPLLFVARQSEPART